MELEDSMRMVMEEAKVGMLLTIRIYQAGMKGQDILDKYFKGVDSTKVMDSEEEEDNSKIMVHLIREDLMITMTRLEVNLKEEEDLLEIAILAEETQTSRIQKSHSIELKVHKTGKYTMQ